MLLWSGAEEWIGSTIVAKIADFATAKCMSETTQARTQTNSQGALLWLAPECFKSHYTTKSDVWAYAMTLYEMLARKLPYGGKDAFTVMHSVCVDDERPNIDSIDCELHDAMKFLLKLMKDCWAKEPVVPCAAACLGCSSQ